MRRIVCLNVLLSLGLLSCAGPTPLPALTNEAALEPLPTGQTGPINPADIQAQYLHQQFGSAHISPDGQRLFLAHYASEEIYLRNAKAYWSRTEDTAFQFGVLNLQSGQLQNLDFLKGALSAPVVWLPSGKVVYVAPNQPAKWLIFDPQTGNEQVLYTLPSGSKTHSLHWAGGRLHGLFKRSMASGSLFSVLRLQPETAATETLDLPELSEAYEISLTPFPDGERYTLYAYSSPPGPPKEAFALKTSPLPHIQFLLLQARSPRLTAFQALPANTAYTPSAQISPEGRQLLLQHETNKFQILDPDTGKLGREILATGAQWLDEEHLLLFTTAQGGGRLQIYHSEKGVLYSQNYTGSWSRVALSPDHIYQISSASESDYQPELKRLGYSVKTGFAPAFELLLKAQPHEHFELIASPGQAPLLHTFPNSAKMTDPRLRLYRLEGGLRELYQRPAYTKPDFDFNPFDSGWSLCMCL